MLPACEEGPQEVLLVRLSLAVVLDTYVPQMCCHLWEQVFSLYSGLCWKFAPF